MARKRLINECERARDYMSENLISQYDNQSLMFWMDWWGSQSITDFNCRLYILIPIKPYVFFPQRSEACILTDMYSLLPVETRLCSDKVRFRIVLGYTMKFYFRKHIPIIFQYLSFWYSYTNHLWSFFLLTFTFRGLYNTKKASVLSQAPSQKQTW